VSSSSDAGTFPFGIQRTATAARSTPKCDQRLGRLILALAGQGSQIFPTSNSLAFWLTTGWRDMLEMANTAGKPCSQARCVYPTTSPESPRAGYFFVTFSQSLTRRARLVNTARRAEHGIHSNEHGQSCSKATDRTVRATAIRKYGPGNLWKRIMTTVELPGPKGSVDAAAFASQPSAKIMLTSLPRIA
jgi:hypothetical protein